MLPEDREDRSSGDESGDGAPGPQRGFGVRIALYLLSTLFALWIGSMVLLVASAGLEATREMLQQAAEGDALALPTVTAFWLQVATAPLVLLVTWLFVRHDGTSLAHLGLRRPVFHEPEENDAGDDGELAAGELDDGDLDDGELEHDWSATVWIGGLGVAAAVLLVGAWRLLAAQWADFRIATAFPQEEIDSMGRWLPLDLGGLLLFFGGFVVAAFVTELIFRGYVFTTLRERLPWVHAAGISSLFFTLFQPTDDSVLAPSLLNLFLVGMLFAALREATGSLWMATAFHATWNLLIAAVFSLPLSGWILPRMQPVEAEGPDWVTGGGFGPEGSWLMTVFLVPAVLAAAAWLGDVDGE